MVVELGVARVLTPVFGGSISVWAIVIATTMLALAAGYAYGGYRADRSGGMVVAGRAAVIGALLCAAIPLIRLPLIEATIELSTLAGAATVALVLIAPSLFFLSQVSPALIRGLASDGVTHVGVTAGGIYAVSTLGSLITDVDEKQLRDYLKDALLTHAATPADLSGPAGGHLLEIRMRAMVTAVLNAGPRTPGGRAIHLAAALVAPSRPGAALAAARRRGHPG